MKIRASIVLAVFLTALTSTPSTFLRAQERIEKSSKAFVSDLTVTNVRTLNDGNSLNSQKNLRFYRDADGSTRLEAGSRVTIIDKKAKKLYILNLENRTAQELDAPQISAPNGVTRKRNLSLNSLDITIRLPDEALNPAPKPLPPITIEGFTANGRELSSTLPAHSATGNERPITRTVQTWHSRDLNLPLKTVISDPIGGTTTSIYKNIKVESSLDRSLFSIPPGFIVRYGTQSRVIHAQAEATP